MSESDLENIISFNRYPNYIALLPLILYLPIGLALCIVRIFIFLHVCLLSYILPAKFPYKSLILRVMLCVTGLPISSQGLLHTDSKKKIIIANHISSLDPFILSLLHPTVLAIENVKTSGHLQQSLNIYFPLPSDKSHAEVIKTLRDKIEESNDSLLFFPEQIKTNGKSSLLKFSLLPFEVDFPIQPVTIQATRYLFDINVSTYASSFYEDLIWCLLLPVTCFSIKYLPVTNNKPDENVADFASRVQSNMAKSLNLRASSFSYYDVTDYTKKKQVTERFTEPAPRIVKNVSEPLLPKPVVKEDEELKRLVQQVKDVLPDTPTHVILIDLKKTRDVDLTITNILEGRVDVSKPEEKNSNTKTENLSFKAGKFESQASARQLSFAERKQAMLEAARIQYRIKHGL
ncbi:ancient ubiquitous protein 1 [Biomphalaria glabrata]|nr:ancient ubiquitous protein 1 [Biomphalaria glabrata]